MRRDRQTWGRCAARPGRGRPRAPARRRAARTSSRARVRRQSRPPLSRAVWAGRQGGSSTSSTTGTLRRVGGLAGARFTPRHLPAPCPDPHQTGAQVADRSVAVVVVEGGATGMLRILTKPRFARPRGWDLAAVVVTAVLASAEDGVGEALRVRRQGGRHQRRRDRTAEDPPHGRRFPSPVPRGRGQTPRPPFLQRDGASARGSHRARRGAAGAGQRPAPAAPRQGCSSPRCPRRRRRARPARPRETRTACTAPAGWRTPGSCVTDRGPRRGSRGNARTTPRAPVRHRASTARCPRRRRQALGRAHAGDRAQRREQVHAGDRHVADRAGRHAARPPADERHAHAALVQRLLPWRSGALSVYPPMGRPSRRYPPTPPLSLERITSVLLERFSQSRTAITRPTLSSRPAIIAA